MPDTQQRYLHHGQGQGERRLSQRLGDIQQEETNDDCRESIVKHEVFIHPVKVIDKKIVADNICYQSVDQVVPRGVEDLVSNVLKTWLSDKIKKGIQMKVNNNKPDVMFSQDVFAIGDEHICVTRDMVKETDLVIPSTSGLPCGRGSITLVDGSCVFGNFRGGRRDGRGCVEGGRLDSEGIKTISGFYEDGVLTGRGRVEYKSGLVVEGMFLKGYLEGFVVGQCMYGGEEVFIGEYQRGVAVGPCWRRLDGGGWLHGVVDNQGHFTGDNILYIYPDLVTCLVGIFNKGIMVEARESTVREIVRPEADILQVLACLPNNDGRIYSYAPSTWERMFVDYQQRDPYETRMVECRESGVENAGEGLFAKRDVDSDTVVCFYHGIYLEPGQESSNSSCDYQIYVDWQAAPDSPALDILPDAAQYKDYKASLGHKVNHSWEPNCMYTKYHHPVFGHTALAIKTIRKVEQGEELTTNYRYDMGDCPQWYYDLGHDKQ